MDPVTGSFLSKDPVLGVAGFSQTFNPYIYTRNNPVNLTDPTGKFVPLAFIAAAAIGGAIIGGITAFTYDIMVNQGYGRGGHNAGCRTDLLDLWQNAAHNADMERAAAVGMMGAEIGAKIGFSAGFAAAASAAPAALLGNATVKGLSFGARLGLYALEGIVGGQGFRFADNLVNGRHVTEGMFNLQEMAADGAADALFGGIISGAVGAGRRATRWFRGADDVVDARRAADNPNVCSAGNSFSADTPVQLADGDLAHQ